MNEGQSSTRISRVLPTDSFLLPALASLAVSMPAFGQETLTRHEAESIEEIVVTAHRPDTLQASALREQLKFALQELLDGIERDEAQMASENPTRSPIRFGYEADRDTGPFIDSEREQVAMSFVRPATILSVGF